MNRNIPSRREIRAARESAIKKARNSQYLKGFTAAALGLTLVSYSAVAAMAATTDPTVPSMDQPLTADQMSQLSGTPTLGPAPTASQIATAQASAPYETITGVSGTAEGLNIDVDMSDPSTALSVNTLSDDAQGHYKIQVLASGTTAGNWTDAVGQTFNSSFGTDAATITVTVVNTNTIDLDVSLATAPSVTPVFTASGSSTGTAPVAQKGISIAVDDSYTLDVSQGLTGVIDVTANDKPATGYSLEPQLFNPITETPTSSLDTGHVVLTVTNNQLAYKALDDGFTGYVNVSLDDKEVWSGPGAEPVGWTAETVTSQLSIHIIGKPVAAPVATDCTVQAAPSGGIGFSVPMASVGGSGLACNLVAVADSVTIAPDATTATVDLTANDIPTNSSYSVDSSSVVLRASDGSFTKDIVSPGQYEISVDPTTGKATPKRIGAYAGKVTLLEQESEFKLDSNGNKVMGGTSSALLTVDFAPVPTTPAPVVPAPVVPNSPVSDIADVPVTATVETPASVSSGIVSRPFANLGGTSASFGGPSTPLSTAAIITPRQDVNAGIVEAELTLIALGTAGAFVVKARHRKVQKSDVSA